MFKVAFGDILFTSLTPENAKRVQMYSPQYVRTTNLGDLHTYSPHPRYFIGRFVYIIGNLSINGYDEGGDVYVKELHVYTKEGK